MENQNKSGASRSLLDIVVLLYSKLWIIILSVVLCALLGMALKLVRVKPTYVASKSVMLMTEISADTTSNQGTTNASLAKLHLGNAVSLMKSPAYMEYANNVYYNEYGEYGYINAGAISANYGEKVLIFTISYSDATPEGAKKKLEAVIKSAQDNLGDEQIGLTVSGVQLKPTQNEINVSVTNNFTVWIVVGGMLGLLGSVGLILLFNALDNTIKSKEELEEITGAGVIAYIDDQFVAEAEKERSKNKKHHNSIKK